MVPQMKILIKLRFYDHYSNYRFQTNEAIPEKQELKCLSWPVSVEFVIILAMIHEHAISEGSTLESGIASIAACLLPLS